MWRHARAVGLKHAESYAELGKYDSLSQLKFQNCMDRDKLDCMYICLHCFGDPKVTLFDSIKMGQKSGPGNLATHLRTQHGVVPPGGYHGKHKSPNKKKVAPTIPNLPPVPVPVPPVPVPPAARALAYPAAATAVASVARAHSKRKRQERSPGDRSASPGRVSVAESTLSSKDVFAPMKAKGSEMVVEEFHTLLHSFVTNNNIAVRTITDGTNCPEFRTLIDFVLSNAKTLSNAKKDLHMGRHQFNSFRKRQFDTLLAAIDMYVSGARNAYQVMLKKRVPFISVGHDIWDSKQKEVLGVTIFFYDPVTKDTFRIPLGLETCDNKAAEATVDQALDMLTAAGIEPEDIFKAANDTTNVALKVGRLLTVTKENGGCAMHEISLAFTHAIGAKKRSRQNKVTDHFDELMELNKKCNAVASYLQNKRNKNRFLLYVKEMGKFGREALKIIQPASTRAAGHQLHFEAMIKARWNFYHYWHKYPSIPSQLDHKEYVTLADISAVLHPLTALIYNVQTDIAGAQAYTFFYIFRTFVLYVYKNTWWVPNVDVVRNGDGSNHWNGNASFPERDWMGTPKGGVDGNYAGGDAVVSMILKKSIEMDPLARTLQERIKEELIQYGAKPTKDRLLAMACNPFTATIGMEELAICSRTLLMVAQTDTLKALARDFKADAM